MGEDQSELAHAVARELRGVEILDDEHAVAGVEDLWDLERPVGILGRDGAVAPGVTAGDRNASFHQPARNLPAGPRLAGAVPVALVPVRAPAGVEEHGVAG